MSRDGRKPSPALTGELAPDEPYFWLRGRDVLAPAALAGYSNLCRAAAHGLEAQGAEREEVAALRIFAAEVESVAAQMIAWQATHGTARLPD
jgi:hypothetical protein